MIMDAPTLSISSPDFFAASPSFDSSAFSHDEAIDSWNAGLSPGYDLDPLELIPSGALSSLQSFGSPYGAVNQGSEQYATQASSQQSGATNVGRAPSIAGQSTPQLRYCQIKDCANTKGFRRESDLIRHHAKHTRPHGCQTASCPASFASRADMVRHRREVHNFDEATGGPSPAHRCPHPNCKRNKRGFARLWNMQQHVRKMHPEEAYAGLSGLDRELTPTSGESEGGPRTPESANIADSSPLIRQHSAPGMMAQMSLDSPRSVDDNGEQLRKMRKRLNEQKRKRESLAEKKSRVEEEERSVNEHIETIQVCITHLERGG